MQKGSVSTLLQLPFVVSQVRAYMRDVLATQQGVAHRWLAPEVVIDQAYSTAADVYSFGLILWELLTWQLPWADLGPFQVITLLHLCLRHHMQLQHLNLSQHIVLLCALHKVSQPVSYYVLPKHGLSGL